MLPQHWGTSEGERILAGKPRPNRGADWTKDMKKIHEERKETILAKMSGSDRKSMGDDRRGGERQHGDSLQLAEAGV